MSSSDQIDDSSAPLIEHLIELRNRIMWSLAAFLVGMMIAFAVWNPIFNFLTQPICSALSERGQDCGLILVKLQEGFFVAIRISVIGGLALSFPVISYQMWRFVAPGLYKSERNAFLPFLIASPVMFFLGAAFAYYVVLPIAFSFFLGFQQGLVTDTATAAQAVADAAGTAGQALTPVQTVAHAAGVKFQGSMEQYLSLTTSFIVAFGLCFQLPVLLTLMGKAGLITAKGLSNVRKYAVVAILVLAAVLTPPDALSQMILFLAVYPLYEVSILLVRRVEKRREADLKARGLWTEADEEAAAGS